MVCIAALCSKIQTIFNTSHVFNLSSLSRYFTYNEVMRHTDAIAYRRGRGAKIVIHTLVTRILTVMFPLTLQHAGARQEFEHAIFVAQKCVCMPARSLS